MIIQLITIIAKDHIDFRLCQIKVLYAPNITKRISKWIIRTKCNPITADLPESLNNILI